MWLVILLNASTFLVRIECARKTMLVRENSP